ncbi:FAD/NAD(P)-binding oxidoreductase [Frigidibacter sp. SD6-1]|uniref:NAD(P)/FAD-dependent oxidoreductase n=1 Tax=Frigidibacter sp. SD6-1 TaxID=3032581 RepID=UPI0024DFDC0B|nr:FAD/NAD(P)-binding oxidoreductase [Frigidibacter sp. SD6-1]
MQRHQILVVGGGSGGLAVTASLLKRRPSLDIAVIEPSDQHFYQPGWTMVGGGVFGAERTVRSAASVLPAGAKRIKGTATAFDPERQTVTLDDGREVGYDYLIMATGIFLDWNGIPGLAEALGKNGVTSNYRFDLAPYTWKLVQEMQKGRAVFSQPPMPIKCPGAPQKGMYLSCSDWQRRGTLGQIEVQFHTATPGLFGVADYVPPLMKYVERYGAKLNFGSRLTAVDGAAKTATFARADADGTPVETVVEFDMLHAVPPQKPVAAVAQSPLADAAGFVEVDQATLRHTRFANVFGLGDGCSTPNSKTAAAARKQAPIVAVNLLAVIDGKEPRAAYDGYGSCPLTVEHGRAILAEFGYGGKLLPSFPWDSTKVRRSAWFLKSTFIPWLYWNAMLKGREWLAAPLEKHQ